MKKRKINCYLDYVEVEGVYNNEVYYYIGGGWTSLALATCMNCSELYVFSEEELHLKEMTLKQAVGNQNCAKCKEPLNINIYKYPETFRTTNGNTGHINTMPHFLTNKESQVIEVWELNL